MKRINSISSNPSILGGTPVVAGTRIPLARIFYLLSQGYTTKNIQKEYPQLSIKTIKEVIAIVAREAEKGNFLDH